MPRFIDYYAALLTLVVIYNIPNHQHLNAYLSNVESFDEVQSDSQDPGFEELVLMDDLAAMTNETNQFVPNQIFVRSLESLNATLHQKWNKLSTISTTSKSPHMVFPHFVRRSKDSRLVLATHLAASGKLEVLLTQLKFWNGPASATIYVKSHEDVLHLMQFLQTVLDKTNEYYDLVFENLSIHVYMENTELPYPHNTLRQTSVDYLDGEYFVALDVDFITNPDCHDQMLATIDYPKYKIKKSLKDKGVFVLPAFERFIPKNSTTVTEEMLPRSKEELLEMFYNNELSPFHLGFFDKGHGPTQFKRWYKQRIPFYSIKYEFKFEPYVLIRKENAPKYFTKFRGYGCNKFSWFVELDRAGYEFSVLRDSYVVHMNHPYGKRKDRNSQGERNNRIFKKDFVPYLDLQYPHNKKKYKLTS